MTEPGARPSERQTPIPDAGKRQVWVRRDGREIHAQSASQPVMTLPVPTKLGDHGRQRSRDRSALDLRERRETGRGAHGSILSCRNPDGSRDMTVNRKERAMQSHRTIVIAFTTLDGFVQDPDGRGGTPNGGWAFRHGPEAVAGDKFRLGPILDTGVLVLGRKTWELFSRIWPGRSDDFSRAMNRIPKLVASRTLTDFGAWQNSSRVDGDLLEAIERQKGERDVVVTGSASVVHALERQDRVDEYRLLVFPTILGGGTRLFEAGSAPLDLRLVSVEKSGAAALLRYERAAATT
jgi:dihydrofolate reductase